MNKTVYSNTRTIIAPEFEFPEYSHIDSPQVMDGLQFLRRFPEQIIPLVFFDPQYRTVLNKLKYGNEGKRQRARAQLPQMDDRLITQMIREIERILIPSGHLMLWLDKYLLVQGWRETFFAESQLKSVDMIVWDKRRLGMGYRSRRCSEYLLILQKPPIRAKGVWLVHNIRDVWQEAAPRSHPHAKPTGLTERLIRAVTNEGDVVVDPAAGSYGVLRAAQRAQRRFLGCDTLPYAYIPETPEEIRWLTAPIDECGYIHLENAT